TLTDEDVAAILLRVGRATITRDAARRSDDARPNEFAAGHHDVALSRPAFRAQHAPRFRLRNPIDGQLIARLGHVVERAAGGEVRIAREVTLRQDDVLRGIADVTEETMAPIVERAAEARAAGEQLEPLRHGIEPEIIPCHHEWLRLGLVGRAHLPPVAAARAVD